MFTIYRLEHESGQGPYQRDNYGESVYSLSGNDEVHSDEEHLSIKQDWPEQGVGYYGEYCCACPSLGSLHTWFEGYMSLLLAHGYHIYQLLVRECVMGKSGQQCFYQKENIVEKTIIHPALEA